MFHLQFVKVIKFVDATCVNGLLILSCYVNIIYFQKFYHLNLSAFIATITIIDGEDNGR